VEETPEYTNNKRNKQEENEGRNRRKKQRENEKAKREQTTEEGDSTQTTERHTKQTDRPEQVTAAMMC
jgi:hypothetical protein